MKISDYAADHPVPITIACALLALFGVLAVASLTQSLFPDFTNPTIYVSVAYPGVAPEEVESQVTSVLEDELAKVPGVISFTSRSLPSYSIVLLEFDWSVNADDKMVEIRERLNAVQDTLPDGVQGVPRIQKMNPSEMPVLTVGLEGSMDLEEGTRYLEDRVIPLIAAIPGVSSVDIAGAPDTELAVKLHPELLSSLGVTPYEVVQALRASGIVSPAGAVTDGAQKLSVTTSSTFSSVDDVENVIVANRGGGSFIRVGDLADVQVATAPPERYSVINGNRTLLVDITAQRGADTVKIIAAAKKVFTSLQMEGGERASFAYYRDQSTSISSSIRSVRNSAVLGGILAVIILFLFLGEVRATVIIALSIPFTVLFIFIALYLNGHSLNTMTLGGLTMAIGMIVDASIVMLDNIWRHAARGEAPRDAAKKGAGEMGAAILASALTSIVVFVPLVFVSGIAGIILRDVALTVIYALAGSVLVALILVPFLSARLLGNKPVESSQTPTVDTPREAHPREPFVRRFGRWIDRLEAAYARILDKALGRAGYIVVLFAAVLVLSISLISTLGFEFIPDADSRELIMELDLPKGLTVEASLAAARSADVIIAAEAPEAVRRVFYVGQSGAWSGSATVPTHVYGIILLGPGGRSSFDLIPVLQTALSASIPDLRVSVRNGGNSEKTAMALGGAGFRISLSGTDSAVVAQIADHVAGILAEDPEVVSATSSVTTDVLSITNKIDTDAAGALGVLSSDVAQVSRVVFSGLKAGDFEDGTDTIPIRVFADVDGGLSEDLLDSIPVRSRSGRAASLGAVSTLEERRGLSEIPKDARLPTVQVVAQLKGSNFRGVEDRLTARLAEEPLPEGVTWKVSGAASETASSFRSLVIALVIAILLVYAVMAIQFERYRQPFIVLMAIPFVLIGVVAALLAFGSSLSIIAILGIISLAGVAVNNAIIMIDYTNLLRTRDGLPLREAILKGASSRLRPILMTTLTTLLGVIPLAFSRGEARTVAVLGQAILGGLTTSTLVSFFLTPCLYWLTESRAEKRAHVRPDNTTETRSGAVRELSALPKAKAFGDHTQEDAE